MGLTPVNAKPADFVLVQETGEGATWVRALQGLNGDGFSDYEHVALYIGYGKIIEMGGGGIRSADVSKYNHTGTRWSSGIIKLTNQQRSAIASAAEYYLQRGIKYSPEDYAALVLHHYHIPFPGLKTYIQATGHMICSQFIDKCYLDGEVHLFQDNRWPGYVTPGDLDQLLSGHQDNEV